MSKEDQLTPTLRHEKQAVVKIVRTISGIQDSLSEARTKPNTSELKKKAKSLIDDQVQLLSGVAPDLVEGIKFLIFEKYTALDLEKHQADLKSGFITEVTFKVYQKLYEDTLRDKARSIPKNTLGRLRLMQMAYAQRRAGYDKKYSNKKKSERSAYQKTYHKENRQRDNKNRRRRRSDAVYRKNEFVRDSLRKEEKLRLEQEEKKIDQILSNSSPTQVFPEPDNK